MTILESVGRVLVVAFVAVVWIVMFTLPFARANDDGGNGGSKGGSSASSSSSAKGGTATATAAGNVSQDNKAYGVGGTGLTSTASCLGSVSGFFGLMAGTYVEKGCVVRLYAAQCKDDKCRQRFACLDPDLMADAKTALGCPKE